MKRKVILRAPVLSQSGYGVHSRQVARWLIEREKALGDIELSIHPVQWGITPWYVDATAKDGLVGDILKHSNGNKGPFDISFQVQLPNEWDPKLATVNVGVTAGVETNVCNPSWIGNVKQMTHVIVPSEFAKSTFERTASLNGEKLDNEISVIPESFINRILDPGEIDVDFETPFNFLLVGQMTGRNADNDRKNIFNTIRWFCEAFKDDPGVGLVIKTNHGRDTKVDRKVTKDTLKSALRHVRKGDYPKIHMIHGALSDEELSGLYRHPKIKAFLTLTRGEGFGLPILEAAASGLPVIATNWSGHTDFLKLGRFVKLDFELKTVHPSRIDKKIFMPNAKWAEVDGDDVKRKLKKFRERHEVPTGWAQDLAVQVKEKFSFGVILPQYERLMEALTK